MVRLTGVLEVTVVEARNLTSKSAISPYCVVELVGPKNTQELGKTITIEDHCDPKWLSTFNTDIDTDVTEIRFTVKDKSLFKDDKIGTCSVESSSISADTYIGSLDILNKKGLNAGKLHVRVKFSDSGILRKQNKFDKMKGCVSRKIIDKALPPSEILHGTLRVSVIKAEGLPNLDSTLLNRKNKSDPFVMVGVTDMYGEVFKLSRTSTINNNLNPEWNESFSLQVCHDVASVVFTVYDEDVMKHDKMCAADIPVTELENGAVISGERPLFTSKNKPSGCITFSVQFIPGKDVNSNIVDKCSFSAKRENKIKFYQDAKNVPLAVPVINHGNRQYTPNDSWQDIQKTLSGAKKFICIAGWSFNASLILAKQSDSEGETIGKILTAKAEEGVDVRILLWDDADSSDAKKDTAKEYFKESLVKVNLISRKKLKKEPFFKDSTYTKYCFSHSQKFIVADENVEESPGLRNVIAYIGCFDLTSGRYDTPNHHLPEGENRSQFANLIANITKSSSKNPWHEVFCKVIGPSAIDVFQNFKDRWEAEGLTADSDFDFKKMKSNEIYLDYSYDAIDSWEVQVFRSICEDSIILDDSDKVFHYGGTRTDDSLHRAYLHHIQKARRFIYIETTNFMGSSHFWDDCCDVQMKNLIPIEITMKIVNQIKQGKPFRVYIVMSMHPDGNSEDSISQEMIHWQYHTMDMMYRRIASAIKQKGLDAQPQDYLLFTCLGKREEVEHSSKSSKQPSVETNQVTAPKHKRSIITVNSKLVIFDDEYIIVGSANINDRSMVGNRNTELGIGAHQPRLASVGNISTYRKCLWVEHMGKEAPIDLDPTSVECINKMLEISEHSLKAYLDSSQPLPKSNLLLYPISLENNGAVTVRSDCEKFPDSKAFVLGTRSKVLPFSVTT